MLTAIFALLSAPFVLFILGCFIALVVIAFLTD